ncbi:MAG TPA: VTT domain-containing protein [Pseudomonadales bacterium]|nr:VTT domain-containing protein [Pseudomonadales bacterium]
MQISKKSLLFTLLLVGAVVAYCSPLRESLSNWREVSEQLVSLGPLGQVAFVIAAALLCAIGVPRLLAYVIGGLAYGLFLGVVLAQVGSMLGAYATFAFARWSGSAVMLRRWPLLNRFLNVVEHRGIISVLVLRQIPLNSFFTNILIGLSSVSHRDFLIGSFIGFLPEGIPAALLGAGLPTGNVDHIVQLSLAAAFLLVFLVWLLRLVTGKIRANSSGVKGLTEILLMVFCGVAGLMLYFSNGVPVLNMWEPGVRMDVSGLESFDGVGFLIAANDRGALVGLRNFFVPAVTLVDLEHYPHITHLQLDLAAVVNLSDSHEKWDAESVRCQIRQSGEVVCFLVSGRLGELLWMTAPSVAAIRQGNLLVRGAINLRDKLPLVKGEQFESILFLNRPDDPIKILLVDRFSFSQEIGTHQSGFTEYVLAFPDDSLKTDTVSASQSGILPDAVCQFDGPQQLAGARISDIGRVNGDGRAIMICTADKTDVSYLVPMTVQKDGVVRAADRRSFKVEKRDFAGHTPDNLKIEGVACLHDNVVVSIDSDGDDGGVYQLGKRFSELCQ